MLPGYGPMWDAAFTVGLGLCRSRALPYLCLDPAGVQPTPSHAGAGTCPAAAFGGAAIQAGFPLPLPRLGGGLGQWWIIATETQAEEVVEEVGGRASGFLHLPGPLAGPGAQNPHAASGPGPGALPHQALLRASHPVGVQRG